MKYLTVKDLKEFIKDLPDSMVVRTFGSDKYGYYTYVPVDSDDISTDVGFENDVYLALDIGG